MSTMITPGAPVARANDGPRAAAPRGSGGFVGELLQALLDTPADPLAPVALSPYQPSNGGEAPHERASDEASTADALPAIAAAGLLLPSPISVPVATGTSGEQVPGPLRIADAAAVAPGRPEALPAISVATVEPTSGPHPAGASAARATAPERDTVVPSQPTPPPAPPPGTAAAASPATAPARAAEPHAGSVPPAPVDATVPTTPHEATSAVTAAMTDTDAAPDSTPTAAAQPAVAPREPGRDGVATPASIERAAPSAGGAAVKASVPVVAQAQGNGAPSVHQRPVEAAAPVERHAATTGATTPPPAPRAGVATGQGVTVEPAPVAAASQPVMPGPIVPPVSGAAIDVGGTEVPSASPSSTIPTPIGTADAVRARDATPPATPAPTDAGPVTVSGTPRHDGAPPMPARTDEARQPVAPLPLVTMVTPAAAAPRPAGGATSRAPRTPDGVPPVLVSTTPTEPREQPFDAPETLTAPAVMHRELASAPITAGVAQADMTVPSANGADAPSETGTISPRQPLMPDGTVSEVAARRMPAQPAETTREEARVDGEIETQPSSSNPVVPATDGARPDADARPGHEQARDAAPRLEPLAPTAAGRIERGVNTDALPARHQPEALDRERAADVQAGGGAVDPLTDATPQLLDRQVTTERPLADASAAPASDAHRAEVVQRIVERVQLLASAGGTSVRMRLTPEHLGAVDVRLIERNGVIEVQLLANSPETRDALAGGIDELKRGIAASGLQVGRVEVNAPVVAADPSAAARGDLLGFGSRGGEGAQTGAGSSRQPLPQQPPSQPTTPERLAWREAAPEDAAGTRPRRMADGRIDYRA